jgi:hypothetical protein
MTAGANVSVFVLEFLLGKYRASSNELAVQMGLHVANQALAENYIRTHESMKAQSEVKEKGRWTFIDKVKVAHVRLWHSRSDVGSRLSTRDAGDRVWCARPRLGAVRPRRHRAYHRGPQHRPRRAPCPRQRSRITSACRRHVRPKGAVPAFQRVRGTMRRRGRPPCYVALLRSVALWNRFLRWIVRTGGNLEIVA